MEKNTYKLIIILLYLQYFMCCKMFVLICLIINKTTSLSMKIIAFHNKILIFFAFS